MILTHNYRTVEFFSVIVNGKYTSVYAIKKEKSSYKNERCGGGFLLTFANVLINIS